jgi:predicted DNA-binding protein
MADLLTSVRFSRADLDKLKLLADLNDSSVAAEIREAVQRHIAAEVADSGFAERLEAKHKERQALVDAILAGTPQAVDTH